MTFYTYMWLREDGTPYYVGKGRGNRAYRRGAPPKELVIVQPYPCEADAFVAEIFLIAFYGRKDAGTGILRNLTDGGQGPSGMKNPNSLANLRRKGARLSEETKRRIGIANKIALLGKTHPIATRQKISESVKQSMTPELLRIRSIAGKLGTHKRVYLFVSPNGQKFQGKGMKGFCRDVGLSYTQMWKLHRGKIQEYRGWRTL